jgi:hypothetical protein
MAIGATGTTIEFETPVIAFAPDLESGGGITRLVLARYTVSRHERHFGPHSALRTKLVRRRCATIDLVRRVARGGLFFAASFKKGAALCESTAIGEDRG